MSLNGQEQSKNSCVSSENRKSSRESSRKSSEYISTMLPPTTNLEEMKIEQLYLLEVLVNSVEVNKASTQKKIREDQGLSSLFVRVKFLDFPCIEISHDDFLNSEQDTESQTQIKNENKYKLNDLDNDQPTTISSGSNSQKLEVSLTSKDSVKNSKDRVSGKSDGTKGKKSTSNLFSSLNTGKSCLFPMLPLELLRQIQRHPLLLQVYRKNTENEALMIGYCKMKLGDECEDAIIKAVFDNVPFPLVAVIENEYKLVNYLGDQTGRINVFVRLSCFGSTIVTQFQVLGQEEEGGYIFKTSKKDNILEMQKKKGGFLFNKDPLKKETVVKSLNIHDISPLQPLISTEENSLPLTGGEKLNYLTMTAPCKQIPWRKYVKNCGCEDPDQDVLEMNPIPPFGSCGCGKLQKLPPYVDQSKLCDVPPCPLSDCDCYSLAQPVKNQEIRLPSIASPSITYKQETQTEIKCCLDEGGNTCNDCPESSSILKQRNSINKRNKCPVDDCDCYPITKKLLQIPNQVPLSQLEKPSFRQTQKTCCSCLAPKVYESKICPGDKCECFNARQRSNFIRKNFSRVSEPQNSLYSPVTTNILKGNKCPDEDCEYYKCTNRTAGYLPSLSQQQVKSSKYQPFLSKENCPNISTDRSVKKPQCNTIDKPKVEENCFFADSKIKQKNLESQNTASVSQPTSMTSKFGYSQRNECLCYSANSMRPYSDPVGNQLKNTNNNNKSIQDNMRAGSIVLPQRTSIVKQAEEPLILEEEKISQKSRDIGPGGDVNKQNPVHDSEKSVPKEKEDDQVRQSSILKEKNSNEESRQNKKRKFRSVFQYTTGMYPGININHKHCVEEFRFVPKTMGWLWNRKDQGDNLKPRRGWKPGAINRTVMKMIKEVKLATNKFVEEENEERKPTKTTRKVRRPFTPRSGTTSMNQMNDEITTIPQLPTLHVHKKAGAYFISMNPLTVDSDHDEEDRPPIMFKLFQHEDEESTSSESSLELEFTAPGAFRKKPLKPVMETIDTQYSDPDSIEEIVAPPARKGKKGTASKKGTDSNAPSTMASVAKDNKWDADQPTQMAKTKK